MKKSDRISALVGQLGPGPAPALDPHYTGFFTCFNAGRYYEAHDVLEHLWLQCRDGNALFYKGLIQIAGAFVHLQKQYLDPLHAKHGRRLRPAARLFQLGAQNLAPFGPRHLHLDVEALRLRCTHLATEIIAADYARNPWHPAHAPLLELSAES
jgi:predicted metal-dependent hydrolase